MKVFFLLLFSSYQTTKQTIQHVVAVSRVIIFRGMACCYLFSFRLTSLLSTIGFCPTTNKVSLTDYWLIIIRMATIFSFCTSRFIPPQIFIPYDLLCWFLAIWFIPNSYRTSLYFANSSTDSCFSSSDHIFSTKSLQIPLHYVQPLLGQYSSRYKDPLGIYTR